MREKRTKRSGFLLLCRYSVIFGGSYGTRQLTGRIRFLPCIYDCRNRSLPHPLFLVQLLPRFATAAQFLLFMESDLSMSRDVLPTLQPPFRLLELEKSLVSPPLDSQQQTLPPPSVYSIPLPPSFFGIFKPTPPSLVTIPMIF